MRDLVWPIIACAMSMAVGVFVGWSLGFRKAALLAAKIVREKLDALVQEMRNDANQKEDNA